MMLTILSHGQTISGDPVRGEELACRGPELLQRSPADRDLVPWALSLVMIALRGQRRFAEALSLAEEAYEVANQAGDDDFKPYGLDHIGRLAAHQGDLERAAVILDDSPDGSRAQGSTETVLYAVNALAEVHIKRGEFRAAADLLIEEHQIRRQVGFTREIGICFDSVAALAAALAKPIVAVRLIAFMSAHYASFGLDFNADQRLKDVRGRLRSELGEPEYDAAHSNGLSLTFDESVALALDVLYGVERSAVA